MAKYRVIGPDELPDAEQALKEHMQFRRDVRYLAATYDDLLAKYSGKWVGIYGEQVMAVGDTPEQLFTAVDAAGVPRAGVVVEHFEPNRIWAL